MKSEEIGNEVLRLPPLSNANSAEGTFDKRSKLHFPHHATHLNSLYYEEPKRVRIHPVTSKSVVNLESIQSVDASKLLREEQQHYKVLQEKISVHYERRMRRFHSKAKSPPLDTIELAEDLLVDKIIQTVTSIDNNKRIATPSRLRGYSSVLRKQKEQSLKTILVVEKPKMQTVETRIKSIVQEIFPLSSEIALTQFIDKFDQMRSLVKTTKEEEKKLEKLIKSEKQSPNRKLEIMKEKKRKIESEVQLQYDSLLRKYFQQPQAASKQHEELFRKKFRKHLRILAKTLMLDKF